MTASSRSRPRRGSTPAPVDDTVGYGAARFENLGPPPSVEGGSGTDRVNFGQNAPAGTIRLDGSSASTGNVLLTGFENATGGPRRDTIFGTDGPNRLTAGDGQGDALHGRGGDDVLDVDDANPPPRGVDDRVEGDAGEDLILSNDGIRDVIECGTSSHTADRLHRQPAGPALDLRLRPRPARPDRPRERLRGRGAPGRAHAALGPDRAHDGSPATAFAWGCAARAATATAAAGSPAPRPPAHAARAAAGVRYRLRAGRRGSVRLPLPAGVRRGLARRGWAPLRLETTESDGQGRPRTQRAAVLLSRRR